MSNHQTPKYPNPIFFLLWLVSIFLASLLRSTKSTINHLSNDQTSFADYYITDGSGNILLDILLNSVWFPIAFMTPLALSAYLAFFLIKANKPGVYKKILISSLALSLIFGLLGKSIYLSSVTSVLDDIGGIATLIIIYLWIIILPIIALILGKLYQWLIVNPRRLTVFSVLSYILGMWTVFNI